MREIVFIWKVFKDGRWRREGLEQICRLHYICECQVFKYTIVSGSIYLFECMALPVMFLQVSVLQKKFRINEFLYERRKNHLNDCASLILFIQCTMCFEKNL